MKSIRRSRFALKTLPAAVAIAFGQSAWGGINDGGVIANLPTGGNGTNISSSGISDNVMSIGISGRSVINWSTFNIGNGFTVSFSGAGGAVLNKVAAGNVPGTAPGVTAPNLSTIAGTLNGQNMLVMLMNPNGIVFTSSAIVNVGALVATTGTIHEDTFISSGNVAISGATGSITNAGRITVTGNHIPGPGDTLGGAGLAALVAPSVINQGAIIATGGQILLAGTQTATISLNNGLYEFAVSGAGTEVTNAVGASLNGASIVLATGDAANLVSGTINLDGIQEATSAIVVNGDKVVLTSDLNVAASGLSGYSNLVEVRNGGLNGSGVQASGGRIQDAVAITKSSGAVKVIGGQYTGEVLLTKAGMTVSGSEGAKLTVAAGQSGFTVDANNTTIEGMKIVGPYSQDYKDVNWDAAPGTTAGVKIQANRSGTTIRDNDIRNLRQGVLMVEKAPSTTITGNTIDNTKGSILLRDEGATVRDNKFDSHGNEWDIVLLQNISAGAYFTSPHVNQASYGSDMMRMSAANGGMHILDRRFGSNGLLGSTPQFGNRSHIVVSVGSNFTAEDDFRLGNGLGNARQPLGFIADGISSVVSGGFVDVTKGTYTQSATLNVNKSLTLRGSGQTGPNATIIDAHDVSGYGMLVTADHVSLSEFTFLGPTADRGDAYGIKVQPAQNLPSTARLNDFNIKNVTSRGAGRAELDLNGVNVATIDGVTADGASTKGAGIQITDSANVVIKNSITKDNLWGGVALYQANRFYNQQMTGIKVEGNNDFREVNPLYLQKEATALTDFGALDLQGFQYAVRNTATVGTGSSQVIQSQYTWMQKTAQGAFDFAVNIGSPDSSYVQGWSGTALTQSFAVGVGRLSGGTNTQAMKIQTAVDRADQGAEINIYPGRYTETASGRTIPGIVGGVYTVGLLVNKDNLKLRGVDAAGHVIANANDVQAWITAGARSDFGMAHGVVANNVTFEGLGFKPKTDYLNKTIEISGDNFTFKNSVVDNRPSTGGTTATGGGAALYFGELDPAGHQITKLTVTGSKFYDGSVVITNGVGATADDANYQPAGDRMITGNTFVGSNNYKFGGVLLNGEMEEIGWREHPIGAVTLTGNTFSGFDESVLVRGEQQGVDLRSIMLTNTFDRAVLVTDASGNVRGEMYGSSESGNAPFFMRPKYSIQSSIQAGINRAVNGDTVNVGRGTYAESLLIGKALTLDGAGKGLTIITPSASNDPVILVKGNIGAGATVAITDLTVQGGSKDGIRVDDTATTLGTLTLERVVVRDNGGSGFISNTGSSRPSAVSTINIVDSVFAGNGGSAGSADINLFFFNGTANLKNVDIMGTKSFDAAADYGLQIRGQGSLATMSAAGYVNLEDVRIAGNYKKTHLAIQRYSDASNIVMSGVRLGGKLENVSVGNDATLSVSGSRADWGTFFSSDMRGNLSLGDTTFDGGVFNPLYGDIRIGGDTLGLKVDATGIELKDIERSRTATGADNFAIEDRVVHALDELGGAGVVLWQANNLYVTQGSGSVQRGVNAASVSDTINVKNVSFAENVVVNQRRNLLFNGSTIGSLTIGDCACGSGIGGTVTATGATGFKFDSPVVLLKDTVLDTSAANRPVTAVAIDGTTAGGQKLTIRSGAGLASLGNLGASTRLGAVDVSGATRFTGSTYFANSLLFAGPMTLVNPATAFRTDGGDIVLNGDIHGVGGNALSLDAGTGNVMLVSGGTESNPLGRLEVDANNFTLQSTLWVSGYDINALGTVALSDHTLRSVGAGLANDISAGGNVTGSTIAESGVQIDAGGDVAANVTSQAEVVVAAVNVSGNLSGQSIGVTAQETVNVAVNAPGPVDIQSGGPANVTGSAPALNIDAPSGSASGSFGQVTNTGGGLIEVNGKPTVNTTVAENANNSRVVPTEVTTGASVEPGSTAQSATKVRRRKLEQAADVLANGESIEIDLSPSEE